jgi:predicted solute-binding protein
MNSPAAASPSLEPPGWPARGGFRLGSVDSLNAVPLTRGLEDRVLFTAPARLAELLRAGRLDAALLSVTEWLSNPAYTALDGIAIASRGPVRSVLLAHRRPLEELRTVHCDPASLASVNLLRVLLAARGLRPAFTRLPDYAAAPACEAVLLIGDRALDFARAGHPHQLWDLGAAWQALTGLPFVYALWTLRPGADAAGLAALLRAARDRGLAELEAIIAARRDYPAAFCREYLTRHIRFDLGAEEKRGIEEFAARLRRLGNGPLYPPRYVPAPPERA